MQKCPRRLPGAGTFAATALLLPLASAAFAQPAAPPPAFEVASVKAEPHAAVAYRSREEGPPPPPGPPEIKAYPGHLAMRNINMHSLVKWAWGLRDSQLSAPFSRNYEILANAGHPVPTSQLRLMLRTLLVERFHLKYHMEKRTLQVSELLVVKGGPKFKESAPGTPRERTHVTLPNGQYQTTWKNTPLEALAAFLEVSTMGPVADRTNLKGNYDFTLTHPRMSAGAPEEFYLAWRDAIQDQLGLTTRQAKGSVDVLVVDHADEVPTRN